MDQPKYNKRVVRVPYDQISPDVLDAIIEEFISREGTDYGKVEVPFEQKVQRVKKQIAAGKVLIVFDEGMNSCNILSKDDPRLKALDV